MLLAGGRYRLIERVGEGGEGEVLRVTDLLRPGEPLALKRLAAHARGELAELLRGEFQVLSALDHPRLARVHDLGTFADEDGHERLFFTREFVEGRCAAPPDGGMATRAALELAVQILRALRPLHGSGLVHGDLKPANAIVGRDGQVRLIDFALAGRLHGGARGLPAGTLRYISPETLEGRVPDVRADLYALGVMLVELLAGEPAVTGDAGEMVARHLDGAISLPSTWRPAGPSAPARREVVGLVSRLSARSPDARFPSADEAEAAILSILVSDDEDPLGRRASTSRTVARDRQRSDVLERMGELGAADLPGAAAILVLGERGSGRTSFLRALRWELQLAGWRVVVLEPSRQVEPEDQVLALVRQLRWHARSTGAQVDAVLEQEDAAASHRRLEAAAAASMRALLEAGEVAVLADDLGGVHGRAARLLRVLGGVAAGRRRAAFAAAAGPGEQAALPALGDGPREVVHLESLTEVDLAGMVRGTLGRDDRGLVERLGELTDGNAALAAHFVELAARGDPRLETVRRTSLPDHLLAMWMDRLEPLGGAARRVLSALALHGRPADAGALIAVAGGDRARQGLEALRGARLVRTLSDGSLGIVSEALGARMTEELEPAEARDLHLRWAGELERAGGGEHLVLHHRALAGERVDAEHAVAVTHRMRALGRTSEAASLLAAVADVLEAGGEQACRVAEVRAELLLELDRPDEGLVVLERVGSEREAGVVARARCLASLGRREEAIAVLERRVGDRATAAGPARELAVQLVHLGRHERAAALLRQALSADDCRPAARAELLATRALSSLQTERLEEALADVAESLRLAREVHDGRMRVRAHWILAMIHQARGDLFDAAASYRQAVDICRRTDDVRSLATLELNLGTLLHRTGEFGEAVDRYLGAIDTARSSGRVRQTVLARIDLGLLMAMLGQTERAALLGRWSLRDAEEIEEADLVARAHGLLGEAARRAGRWDEAVEAWTTALDIHRRESNLWEQAEILLELVSPLLGVDPPRLEEAEAGLEQALELIDASVSPLLSVKCSLARARLCLARGEAEGALERARAALAACRRIAPEWDDYSWQAFDLMARAHARLGSDLLRRRSLKRAVEALEEASLKVPSRFQEGFAQVAGRRELLGSGPASADAEPLAPDRDAEAGQWRDTLMRLMEINRRLATTRDPEQLFAVILDSAVEFTGAERGLMLVPEDGAHLRVAGARDFYEGSVSDEHMVFSTSIARQVHAAAEPVITVSAMEDDRFGHARSVHELRLQSILCLPIKGRREVIGVLYLENRLRRGKFTHRDRDLLAAFCDQLAIAVETARLLELSAAQKRELERLSEERARLLERRTRELKEARRDLREARTRLEGKNVFHGMVGTSPAMRRVFSVIDRVGESDVPVVIAGESGTGKDMAARAVHAGGARRQGPFVAINCGALPSELLESELFGHVKGAFTGAVRDKKGVFAQASGGTLLLDEVGDMTPKMQLGLLRVLQENVVRPVGSENELAVDARVVAATQRPLEELLRRGTFREDLFYRMSVVQIVLPPLRDRRDDIPLLVDHFLSTFTLRYGTQRPRISRRAVRMLVQHDWPGNVRQLEHALLNAWVLSEDGILDVEDFETLADRPSPPPAGSPQAPADDIESAERRDILEALRAARWNKTAAARALGIPRRTFYRRLKKHGLLK